jgi:transposase
MKLPGVHGCLSPVRVAVDGRELCEQLGWEDGLDRSKMETKKTTGSVKMRRTYDEDYKRHAVALTLQSGRRVSDVATELGINLTMLYEWRRQYAPQPRVPNGVPQTPEEKDAEIRRLRAELVRMQERESVLKKSLGILSETPESGMPRCKR